MKNRKKELKKLYKENPPEMGVFLIRNTVNDKIFLGVGQDIQRTINRHKFQLKAGCHPKRSLQADWNEFGAENFAFEILDQISHSDNQGSTDQDELVFFDKLWQEKLQPFGDRGYNARPQSREEKLKLILKQGSNAE